MTSLSISPSIAIINAPTQTDLGILATLKLWSARHTQRKALLKLPAHLLEDIGVTQEQVEKEANLPFWK